MNAYDLTIDLVASINVERQVSKAVRLASSATRHVHTALITGIYDVHMALNKLDQPKRNSSALIRLIEGLSGGMQVQAIFFLNKFGGMNVVVKADEDLANGKCTIKLDANDANVDLEAAMLVSFEKASQAQVFELPEVSNMVSSMQTKLAKLALTGATEAEILSLMADLSKQVLDGYKSKMDTKGNQNWLEGYNSRLDSAIADELSDLTVDSGAKKWIVNGQVKLYKTVASLKQAFARSTGSNSMMPKQDENGMFYAMIPSS